MIIISRCGGFVNGFGVRGGARTLRFRTLWFSPDASADFCCPTRTAHKKSFRGLLVNPHDSGEEDLRPIPPRPPFLQGKRDSKKIIIGHLWALPLIQSYAVNIVTYF